MLRSAPPIFVDLKRWDQRPGANELRTAKTEIEETIRAGFEKKRGAAATLCAA